MRRKLLLLDLTLLALVIFLAVQLRGKYDSARQRENALLSQRIAPIPAPAVTPIPPVAGAKAMAYVDVAQNLVFSRDRNPNVIIDPVIPPPPKQMPPLPRAHGVMAFGGTPTVILSERAGAPHQGYRPGDSIGPFKLLAVNNRQILFEWEGLRVLRDLEEITDRDGAGATAPAPSTPVAGANEQQTTVVRPQVSSAPEPGADIGNDMRACNPGDNTPHGTVVNGYRKILTPTPFGSMCRWEAVR